MSTTLHTIGLMAVANQWWTDSARSTKESVAGKDVAWKVVDVSQSGGGGGND